MLETATDKIFCFQKQSFQFSACSVATFIHFSCRSSSKRVPFYIFPSFFEKRKRIAESLKEDGTMGANVWQQKRTMKKAFALLRQKLFFILLQNNVFLQKKRQRIEFFAGFGAIDGMKHTVPVHVFNFILFFSNRRRDERKNSLQRISTIHSKQQEKTFCDVEDNKNTLRCILYAHTYTNFASRYLRKHM